MPVSKVWVVLLTIALCRPAFVGSKGAFSTVQSRGAAGMVRVLGGAEVRCGPPLGSRWVAEQLRGTVCHHLTGQDVSESNRVGRRAGGGAAYRQHPVGRKGD